MRVHAPQYLALSVMALFSDSHLVLVGGQCGRNDKSQGHTPGFYIYTSPPSSGPTLVNQTQQPFLFLFFFFLQKGGIFLARVSMLFDVGSAISGSIFF